MLIRKLYLFAAFLLIATVDSKIVLAQTKTTQDTLTFQNPYEIKVTAPRINLLMKDNPSATTVIGKDILQDMPRAVSADEALMLVPGVRIDNQANGSRIHMSIRGQGILSEHGLRGIKVLLDGIPLNDPTGFASDLYDVDWETVDKVEVLRGPAAALYGGGSNAGVLNIITMNGDRTKPLSGEVFSSFGSNGFWKTGGQIFASSKNIDYRFSISRMMGDGYRVHSGFQGNNIYSKLNWSPTENVKLTQIFGVTTYYNENAEGLTLEQVQQDPRLPNDDAIPLHEFQETNRIFGGIVGSISIDDAQDISFNAFVRSTTYKEPGSTYIWHSKFLTPGVTLQYNAQQELGSSKNFFSIGSDLEGQTIDEYTMLNLGYAVEDSILTSNETIQQTGLGVFLIDRLELNSQLSFLASLRYDKITNKLTDLMNRPVKLSGDVNFDKATARIGVNYSPSQLVSIYANWGQGFLPPSTEELSSNPDNPGGFNKNLAPSTSQCEELGIRGLLKGNLYYDLSVFYLTTNKDFDRYRILPQRPLETFYRNAGSSRRYGLETFISWEPIKPLFVKAAYTYSNFKYTAPDSINGNWLPNSPEHKLTIDVEYKLNENLSIGLTDEMQSKWYIFTNNNSLTQDGFNLVNARVTYTWHVSNMNGEFMFAVKNIFDKTYMAFTEPDPDGNSYQPGPKREIFGGIKIQL